MVCTINAQPFWPYTSDEYPLTVPTSYGFYTGLYMNTSRAFLGVPYAQPPIGNLRFKPPQSLQYSWGNYSATLSPPSCWQSGKPTGYNYSEDCLYMNIYTPRTSPSNSLFPSLPVMVWIHGGRYWTGSTKEYNGDMLSSLGNTIVVVIQYRLNIFGFQSFDSNTNNGLLDQQMALRWVQRNIRSFGGDPNRVTIFGESAGGSSVLYHLTIPGSFNLYNRAIAHSAWQFVIPTAETSRQKTVPWAALKGCANVTATGQPDYTAILSCLQSKPASDITPSTGQSDFMLPMIDNTLISNQLQTSFKLGKYNKLANIIIGHNYDEGNFMAYSRLGFVGPTDPVSNATLYDALVRYLNVYFQPNEVQTIVSWYLPVAANLTNWYGGAEFFGDYYIICGSIMVSKYLSDQGAKIQNYIFDYSSPNYPSTQRYLAASHGNELPYVFYQPVYTYYPFAVSDYAISARMARSWTDFATNGNPTNALSYWPTYPNAMYYGQDVNNFSDNREYLKGICENWRPYFEAY